MTLYGGLEAGGIKCVCAVGSSPADVRRLAQFATTTPFETLARALFAPYRAQMRALGVAVFGPLDPPPEASTCVYITSTPNLAGPIPTLLAP